MSDDMKNKLDKIKALLGVGKMCNTASVLGNALTEIEFHYGPCCSVAKSKINGVIEALYEVETIIEDDARDEKGD